MAKVVTITNPLTGQPAQVDQLDHTAQQIDDAVEAARWSHRSLLDNAYWANPDAIIDQRGGYVVPPGVTVYTDSTLSTAKGTTTAYNTILEKTASYARYQYGYVAASDCVRGYVGARYTIDRWKSPNAYCIILVGKSGITISASGGTAFFRQLIDNPEEYYGRIVTISVLTSDGRLCTATGTVPKIVGSSAVNVATATISTGNTIYESVTLNNDGTIFVQFRVGDGLSVTVSAAKLELGTVQTLAHQDENGNWVLNDPPPDKGMELLKCHRYYTRVEIKQAYNNTTGLAVPIIVAGGGIWANILIELPSMMRVDAKPVVKVSGLSVADFSGNQIADIASDAAVNVAAFTGSMVVVSIKTTTSLAVGYSVLLKQGGYIEIINDL